MRQYEVMVILDPSLDERTVAPSLDTFLNVIRQEGGSVDKVDVWGKRRFAYEIDHKTEGFYVVFEILAEPDTHSDPHARCELVAALGSAAGARGMVGGQMIDMAAEGRTLTAAEVTRLQALKTGRLIQYSAEAGAILGRAAPALRAQAEILAAQAAEHLDGFGARADRLRDLAAYVVERGH